MQARYRILHQAAVCKNPRAARVADAVGRTFANGEGTQLPRGGVFREIARQRHFRTKFLCPQLCVFQRVDGCFHRVGVQKMNGGAPLFGKHMQFLRIFALPVGAAHGEREYPMSSWTRIFMFRISSSRTISAISSPSFRSASFAASSRAFSARSLVRTAINSETSAAMTSVYGMANGTERQLLIVDADGQTYTSGMTLLEQEQAVAVIEAVLSGAAESGQMVLSEANAICTWSRSADTLSAVLCVFRIRVLFCSEMISGAEAAHKIDRMAPSGRSQRRR